MRPSLSQGENSDSSQYTSLLTPMLHTKSDDEAPTILKEMKDDTGHSLDASKLSQIFSELHVLQKPQLFMHVTTTQPNHEYTETPIRD